MNNNLKNYTTQPDPEVWNKIQKTLRRQEFRRQAVGGSIGMLVAVAAIATVVLWPYDTKNAVPQSVLPPVAQVTETVVQPSPANEPLATQAAQQLAQQQPVMNPTAQQQMVVEMADQQLVAPAATALATVMAPSIPAVEESKVESKPAVENRSESAAVSAAKTIPAKPKREPSPVVEEERPVVENIPATKAEKSTINNGVIEDTILWVPNAFAPNSDNPDITTFRARLNKSDASVANYRITIFNRQGHQVFHSIDINQAWDGTYKGRALPQGGYVYVIFYVDKDGLTHQRKGTVALIR